MYFDAHLACPSGIAPCNSALAGGILFGASSQIETDRTCARWLHAAPLPLLIGAQDPRFPTGSPRVFDLRILGDALLKHLYGPPATWYALLETLRLGRGFLHLNLPAGTGAVQGLRRLAGSHPHVRFLIDAYRQGPAGGWQAHVRLCECENIWTTTLGLLPGPDAAWNDSRAAADALHFAMGEVGASKVLFASGHACDTPLEPAAVREWASGLQILDAAQQELILILNAQELFA